MTKIKDLPGASTNFRVNVGVSNFSKKFSRATRAGELSNLHDNKDSIIKVLKKNETAIRRGTFSRVRRIKAWSDIKKLEGSTLTKTDAKQIKSLLKYLSDRDKEEEVKSKVKIQKQLAKDESFEEERKAEEKKGVKIEKQLDVRSKRLTRTGFANQDETNIDTSISDKLLERRFGKRETSRAETRMEEARARQSANSNKASNISFGNQPVSRPESPAQDRAQKVEADRFRTIEPGREKNLEPGRHDLNSRDLKATKKDKIDDNNTVNPFQNL